ncbi:hypothetical protein GZ78_14115 [Endozoicomonas numazuensis]|uniref:Uncharacterized protein n=1 Tax=Endozoicomonas numazuensis TaxID=1137799 RepID=A0A081NF15_9GAMM|nr:hypothetical protein GZ78_14115 [Endozoicomonas numazuensis]
MRGNSYFIPQQTPQPIQARDQILGDNPSSEPVKHSRPGSSATGSGVSQRSTNTGSPDSKQQSPVEVNVGSPESWLQRQNQAVFSNRNSDSEGAVRRRGRGRTYQCRALDSASPSSDAPQQMHFDVTVMPGEKEGTTVTRTQYTRIHPVPDHKTYDNLGFSSMELLQVLYVEDAKESNDADEMLQSLIEGDENEPVTDIEQYSEEQVRALEEFRRRARRALVQHHGEYIDGLWGISCGWAMDALYDIATGTMSMEMTHSDHNPILLVPILLNQVPEVLVAGLQNLQVPVELLAGLNVVAPVVPPAQIPLAPAPALQPVHDYENVPLEANVGTGSESNPTVSSNEAGQTPTDGTGVNPVAQYDQVALDTTDEGQTIVGPWDLLTGNDPMTSVRRRGYELMQMALRNDDATQDRDYQLSRVRLEIRNNSRMIPDRAQRLALLERFEKALNGEIFEFRLWGINVVPKTCKEGAGENNFKRDDEDPDSSGAGGTGRRTAPEKSRNRERNGGYFVWQPSGQPSGQSNTTEHRSSTQGVLSLVAPSMPKINGSGDMRIYFLNKTAEGLMTGKNDLFGGIEKKIGVYWLNNLSQ